MSLVVVIGAGVGGLAAAARLAAQGHGVTLLEAQSEVGGKLGLYERDGFRFDTGPSLLTLPQVFRDLFDATGGWPAGLELVPLDPIARYRWADGSTVDVGADDDLDALRPGNADDWRRLMHRAQRIWDASHEAFLESPLDARSLARLALSRPRDITTIAPTRSLRSLGHQHLRDPRLRMMLDRYATYTGSDPRRAPAALASVAYAERAFGGWYVQGGLRRLADALHDRVLERGVTVVLNARATHIETVAGKVDGVRLADGGRLPADVVIANADASTVYGGLLDAPELVPPGTPSLSGFVLLLAVDGRTPGLAHHNVHFPADYDAEFDAIFGPDPRPVPDPTLSITAPDDPAVRPPGTEAWFVLVNAPRHGQVDWKAERAAYAEHLVDLLEARWPGVRDRIRWSEAISPADLEACTGAPGGAIYGSSSNGPRAAFLRPANRSPVQGLFLVGGSAHPGGGLPLVALSAQIVARLVGTA